MFYCIFFCSILCCLLQNTHYANPDVQCSVQCGFRVKVFAKSKHCRKAKETVSLICYRLEMFFFPLWFFHTCNFNRAMRNTSPHPRYAGVKFAHPALQTGLSNFIQSKKTWKHNEYKNDLDSKYISYLFNFFFISSALNVISIILHFFCKTNQTRNFPSQFCEWPNPSFHNLIFTDYIISSQLCNK